jgi:hypothetical protein
MTLNQILKTLNIYADNNPMIQRFGTGDIWESSLVSGDDSQIYPVLWVVPQSVIISEDTIKYNLRLAVFEQQSQIEEQKQEILSNTLRILQDVDLYLRNMDDDIEFKEDLECVPFHDRFSDYCAGWSADIVITVAKPNSPCDII